MKHDDYDYYPRQASSGGNNLGAIALLLVMIGAFFLLWPKYENPPEPTAFKKCIWTAGETCLATSLIDKGGRFLSRNDVYFASASDWKTINPAAAQMSPEFFDPLKLTADEKTELAAYWRRWQAQDHFDFAESFDYRKAPPLLSLLKR